MSMDTQKDGTNVENISNKCRPSVITEEYKHLSFQTASSLKQQFTKSGESGYSELWQRYICAIYVVNLFVCSNIHITLIAPIQQQH